MGRYSISTAKRTFPAILGAFSVPLIKKAIISATVHEHGATVLLLDGHNNPGFSGGPIVYRDLNRFGGCL
jgi:hypothetical protein